MLALRVMIPFIFFMVLPLMYATLKSGFLVLKFVEMNCSVWGLSFDIALVGFIHGSTCTCVIPSHDKLQSSSSTLLLMNIWVVSKLE